MTKTQCVVDRHGFILAPMDLVRIVDLPEFVLGDDEQTTEEVQIFKKFQNCYGIITFLAGRAFLTDTSDVPGWRSRDFSHAYVNCVVVVEDHISSFDFFAPTEHLIKLEPNVVLLSLFVDYPLRLNAPIEREQLPAVRRGMHQFSIIESILNMPFQKLEELGVAVSQALHLQAKESGRRPTT